MIILNKGFFNYYSNNFPLKSKIFQSKIFQVVTGFLMTASVLTLGLLLIVSGVTLSLAYVCVALSWFGIANSILFAESFENKQDGD
jgi:hypothetical protein